MKMPSGPITDIYRPPFDISLYENDDGQWYYVPFDDRVENCAHLAPTIGPFKDFQSAMEDCEIWMVDHKEDPGY